MDIKITFPGGVRVDAALEKVKISTDQPLEKGGDGTAPSPFDYFISAIGTCAGYYVISFCQKRNISSECMRIIEHVHSNPDTHMVENIELEIQVPPEFPEKYYESLIRSAQLCTVKKHLESPPKIEIYTHVSE